MTRTQSSGDGASFRTALVALVSNVVVALSRLGAGLITGSATLLAEAAHAVADSCNQLLLALSVREAKRPPTAEHPFGFQGRRFLWAFVAAVGTFAVGGLVSVGLGMRELLDDGGDAGNPLIGFIVIGVSFVADGISFAQAVRQARARAEKAGQSVWRLILQTKEPIVRAVVVEDAIALVGDVMATLGLGLRTLTGSVVPDAVGAMVVGLILAVAAYLLARTLGDLLIGRGLPPREVELVRRVISADPAVKRVLSITATYLGPNAALVVAKVVPVGGLDSLELAGRFSELDVAIRGVLPIVADVYLDPTDQEPESDDYVSPVLRFLDDGADGRAHIDGAVVPGS